MAEVKENLIQDIRNQLETIKYQVQSEGFGGFVLMKLMAEESALQQELNRLLNRKSILTETEADAIYERLRLSKRDTLKNQSKKNVVAIVIGVAVIGALAYFTFKKPKQ